MGAWYLSVYGIYRPISDHIHPTTLYTSEPECLGSVKLVVPGETVLTIFLRAGVGNHFTHRASSKALAPSSQPLHLPTAPRGKGVLSRPPVLAST